LGGDVARRAAPDHGIGPRQQAGADVAEALRRFQQLTPPLAAKALEDTLFYRYGPLLSRNEVGASPARFALAPEAFHALVQARATDFPHAMLATATHDHKRGEDTRCRLAVLSEMPEEWRKTAYRWIRALPDGGHLSLADRYMLVQTLVGAWPADWAADTVEHKADVMADWTARVAQWQLKALREAKIHTSWTDPDPAYEDAARATLAFLQDAGPGRRLMAEIAAYALGLAPAGMINSLSQTLLRNTLPGVPDLYQGTELWDYSLVDPDNRRAVDYPRRISLLAQAPAAEGRMSTRESDWRSGAVKQALIQRLLAARRRHPALSSHGGCDRLKVTGPNAHHVLAWLRRDEEEAALIIAPRLCARQLSGYASGEPATARQFWAGTAICPPDVMKSMAWRNAVSGERVQPGPDGALHLHELLHDLPVALCLSAHP
ncbi:MAG TPA: malto-oligosyltrehalose synthase, partial [Achromobacter sp.]